MYHSKKQPRQANHLILMLAIVAGIALGNLLSSWYLNRTITQHFEKSVAVLSDTVSSLQVYDIQEQLSRIEESFLKQEQHRELTREQRATSQMGQMLEENCIEWKASNLHYKNLTSGKQARKACYRYENFLATGIVPTPNLNQKSDLTSAQNVR